MYYSLKFGASTNPGQTNHGQSLTCPEFVLAPEVMPMYYSLLYKLILKGKCNYKLFPKGSNHLVDLFE